MGVFNVHEEFWLRFSYGETNEGHALYIVANIYGPVETSWCTDTRRLLVGVRFFLICAASFIENISIASAIATLFLVELCLA